MGNVNIRVICLIFVKVLKLNHVTEIFLELLIIFVAAQIGTEAELKKAGQAAALGDYFASTTITELPLSSVRLNEPRIEPFVRWTVILQ